LAVRDVAHVERSGVDLHRGDRRHGLAPGAVAGVIALERWVLSLPHGTTTGGETGRMAPCGWCVRFRLAKGLPSVKTDPMGKVDWFSVLIVMLGMLPVVMAAALLFWR
jgi:hypothetical protein